MTADPGRSGGEGTGLVREHVDHVGFCGECVLGFLQIVASDYAYNGSEVRDGQRFYDWGLNSWLANIAAQVFAQMPEQAAPKPSLDPVTARDTIARALWMRSNPRPPDWDAWPEWDRNGFLADADAILAALASQGRGDG